LGNIYYNNWNRRSGQGFPANLDETASVLIEAVKLYESSGYQAATGVETARCDRVYVKFLPSPTSTE